MNGSEAKYNREYVEIRTTLEHIRTKLEAVEDTVATLPPALRELRVGIEQNRCEISALKSTSAILGGLAGAFLSVFTRILFWNKNG